MIDPKQLAETLRLHSLWLDADPKGVQADLHGADLRGANLRGANLTKANLRGANLREADLTKANLLNADLRDADLSEADLARVNLSGADLARADLSGADLARADLTGASLIRTRLTRAILAGACMSGADLYDADLIQVNLTSANLTGANLRGAALAKASLAGADLTRANLAGADLRAVKLPDDYRVASLCFGGWVVTVTPTSTTIGCQTHPNTDWLRWTPEDVVFMHPDAKAWWTRHRDAVCAVIRDVIDFWEFCRRSAQEVAEWPGWKKAVARIKLGDSASTTNPTLSEALAEVERLRERNAKLERALEEREADIHSRIRAGYDKTVADSWRAANEKLQHENAALRERVAVLERVLDAAEPCVDALRDIAGDGHGEYLDQWAAAIEALDAAEETTDGN